MLGLLVALSAILQTQVPDSSARARRLAALQAFDDSLTTVSSAASAFRADLAAASPDLVVSRAARMQRRCAAAGAEGQRLATVDSLDASLRRELGALRAALGQCVTDFATGSSHRGVDSLAAWGPYRLVRLDSAIRRYRMATHEYKRRLGPPS